MPATDLLVRTQASHTHLAIVIDEYGGTEGLVSIEDLVADRWLKDDERPYLYEDRTRVDFGWVARTRAPALRVFWWPG